MRVIIVPTDGQEYVLVPKVALESAEESLGSFCSGHDWTQDDMDIMDGLSAILAAPRCKAVELPEQKKLGRNIRDYSEDWWYAEGFNACLDEIERRSKG